MKPRRPSRTVAVTRAAPLPHAVGREYGDAPCLLVYLPLSLGETVWAAVAPAFADCELWPRGISTCSAGAREIGPNEFRGIQLIDGRFAPLFRSELPLSIRYFTFIRNPLLRAIAHYDLVLGDQSHPLHRLTREIGSFGAYLRDARTQPTITNVQLRYLTTSLDTGATPRPDYDARALESSWDVLLHTATARLDQMCAVGLAERLQDSLALVCEIFGWPLPRTGGNEGQMERLRLEQLSSEDLRLLKRLNEAELDLYAVAAKRFEHDWARSRFIYPHLHAFVSYAQNAEDVLLYRALRNVSAGTYVDVGANDPSGDSVTKAFYERGWRGINIEPVTSLYEALAADRPEDTNIHAAAGSAESEQVLYEIPGTGLSTLDAAIARRHRRQGFKVTAAKVRVRTLRGILAQMRGREIHFLKVDVEGWERDVLQGMDWSSSRPWIVLVEATKPNTQIPSYEQWEPVLLQNGYSFVFFDGLNRYYVAHERSELRQAFSHPVSCADVFVRASEAAASRALRVARREAQKQAVTLRERTETLHQLTERARQGEAWLNELGRERDLLKERLANEVAGRIAEREEAIRQTEALTKWATSADAHGKSLLVERDKLRSAAQALRDARDLERKHSLEQVEALTKWASSAEAYGKSLIVECEKLRESNKLATERLEAERRDATDRITALSERAAAAESVNRSLVEACEELRNSLEAEKHAGVKSLAEFQARLEASHERAATAEANGRVLREERDSLVAQLCGAQDALSAVRVETDRQLAEAQATLRRQIETQEADHERARKCAAESSARMAELLALNEAATGKRIRGALELQQERLDRMRLQRELQAFENRAQRAEATAQRLTSRVDVLQISHRRSLEAWKGQRAALIESMVSAQEALQRLRSHWVVRLLADARRLKEFPMTRTNETKKRRIGVFTIASKNYLAYVRVLLKSVAAIHPEYALYLCLADKVDGAFDPEGESFEIVESDSLGIPCFTDMTLRYDIMEFNTAVKPFMFQWLMDNTELDSFVYIDPDIRVYSKFDELESALESGCSVVLTPHIMNPIEDGRSPNDHHMLQAGVFNLGFAAMNRCDEARHFVEWWGRRLETQASVDLPNNLFTDQRWCDLAPCFLPRLHVLRAPGYNVAYWNLTERDVRRVNGEWEVNGEPLSFFHFSGISVDKEAIISKHQNRFVWQDVPHLKELFDGYRDAVLAEGWEQARNWKYAYATTADGTAIPSIVRQLYREHHRTSIPNIELNVTARLRLLCNSAAESFPKDGSGGITKLMEFIYRKRADLQAAFNLNAVEGRAEFRRWYAAAIVREYGVPPEIALPMDEWATNAEQESVRSESLLAGPLYGDDRDALRVGPPGSAREAMRLREMWDRLSPLARRLAAPIIKRLLRETAASPEEEVSSSGSSSGAIHCSSYDRPRVDRLFDPAPVPRLIKGRYINRLMHIIWRSRTDLRAAFNLNTVEGQAGYLSWLATSGVSEYGEEMIRPEDGVAPAVSSAAAGTNAATVPGAHLIGYAHAELGMGEHVRMSAAALDHTSVPFSVIDFNVGIKSRQKASLDHGRLNSGQSLAANVFHVNADQMLIAYRHLGHEFFRGRYNIGYWAWELAKCPEEFLGAVDLVDEIWAPSRFVQSAFAERAEVPVEYMPLCVTLPAFERLGRSRFSLPEDAYTFLYTFDFMSFWERKNPLAAIRAFVRAFPRADNGVCLVLKIMNGREHSTEWLDMQEAIGGDPRIVVINETLGRREVLALLDACDCFVSLHRSEGFGRGPAEAMYLGKPVIVTNYSGNTDFTRPDNSCLVDYRLIPVENGQYPFSSGQYWADPDVEQAAWYMRRLCQDRTYATEIAERGEQFIRSNFSERAIGEKYAARLKSLGLV